MAEGLHQVGQIPDPRRVTWGTEQGMLTKEDSLSPLPQAILHEGLRVLVPIVGEDHVGLYVACRMVDILPHRELDWVSCLPLKVGSEIITETTILRGSQLRRGIRGKTMR